MVAGPVANKYEKMIAPVLAPSPGKTEGVGPSAPRVAAIRVAKKQKKNVS